MKNIFTLLLVLCSLCLFSCQNKSTVDLTGSWMGWIGMEGDHKIPVLYNIEHPDTNYIVTFHDLNSMVLNRKADLIVVRDSIYLNSKEYPTAFWGVIKSDTLLTGIYRKWDKEFPISLVKQSSFIDFKRPQTPNLTHNSYHTEYVSIRNKREPDIVLDGDLFIPKEGKDFPAVILIHGSGSLDKDETIAQHRIFWVLADYLARNGIAVLRYDKRGFERSSGNPWTATSIEYASDALAVWEYMREIENISKDNTGIIGHSEGGMIAFMLAAENLQIPYIVSIAGPAFVWDEIVQQRVEKFTFNISEDDQHRTDSISQILDTTPPDTIMANYYEYIKMLLTDDKKDSLYYQSMASLVLNQYVAPWMIYFREYDPTENLKKIKCPVFALNGEKDCQVISGPNLQRIDSLIRSNGNLNVTIKEYADINHMMQTSETGLVYEYALIEETFAPEIMQDIVEWILKNKK